MSKRLASLLFLVCLAMSAQVPRRSHTVQASGDAVVSVKPDRARVSLGIVNEAPTASAAATQNAQASSHLLDVVKQALHGTGEIQTSGYSISASYDYSKPNTPPRLIGYRASNTVMITLDDLTQIGKVLDAATAAGANSVDGISFMLRHEQSVRLQALSQAAEQARANAEAIAKALHLRVLGTAEARSADTEPVASPRPVRTFMQMDKMAAPTPVEAGTLDVRASVVVTLEIAEP